MEVRAEGADGGAFTQSGTPQSHHHAPHATATQTRTPVRAYCTVHIVQTLYDDVDLLIQ